MEKIIIYHNSSCIIFHAFFRNFSMFFSVTALARILICLFYFSETENFLYLIMLFNDLFSDNIYLIKHNNILFHSYLYNINTSINLKFRLAFANKLHDTIQ